MVSPFPFRPMHAWLIWCWPVCVWSVYGHVVAAAVVLLVHGRVRRLMVRWFSVVSLALQRAFAQLDLVRVGALLVSVLVGASCVGAAWYVLTVRRFPTAGKKSNDRWFDRSKEFPNSVLHSLSRPGSVTCTTHHLVFRSALRPSFQLRLYHSYVHPSWRQGPVGPPWCNPVPPMGAPGRCSGSVVRFSCSCLPVVRRIVPCLASYVAAVSASQCSVWRLGWLGRLGSCFVAGTLRPAWRARSGLTHPCPLAGAGEFAGPVWRTCGPLCAPGRVSEGRNTGQ